MNKFTIFTIILTVSVVTVMADLVVRDYFGGGSEAQTSVVQDTEKQVVLEPQTVEPASESVLQPSEISQPEAEKSQLPVTPPPSVITEKIIKDAGFKAAPVEKHFDGKVFQLLDITKIPVDAINFYEIVQDGGHIASITEIALRDEIRALQLYILLQNKTKPYIDLSLNETNAYGDRSFYINHVKKPSEAFLTVKIGKTIYGFAYVKSYHPEIKKLMEILSNI